MIDKSLEKFFAPDPDKGIVIYGATDALDKTGEKKLGQVITENISATYAGNIYCINPKRVKDAGGVTPYILGKPVYSSAVTLPTVPDIAIVVTPASSIPDIIQECADAGIPVAVVFAAGFQEMGKEGIALAKKVLEIAKKGGVRLCGPNCFGVFGENFNGTFSRGILAGGGYIGYISQSGGIVCGPLDTIGKLSRAASVGSMIDVTWGEMIRLFGDHEPTKAILLYLESIGENGADFIEVAREVGRRKLIVALKAGRTDAASKAAASHTGAVASNHKVFLEACREAGIIVAEDLAEADDFLEFAKQPLPKGNRLVVLTNGGGPVVLASEQLELHGGKMSQLSKETLDVLNADMPATWSHGNPIDIIGDASSIRYRIAIQAALAEKESDGVLLTYVPVAMSNPTDIARIIIEEGAKYPDKPIIVSFTGSESVKEAKRLFREAGLSVYDNPDTAARIFAKLAQRQKWLNEGKEASRNSHICRGCPHLHHDCLISFHDADKLLSKIYQSGRTILTEYEAKKILGAYCIPVGETFIAKTPEEAVGYAEKFGYPVVLKLHSTTLTHKSDVGGVELNLKNGEDVFYGFFRIKNAVNPEHFEGVNVQKMEITKGEEVLLGAKTDPSFGKVIAFGMGGTRAEFFKDVALTVLPVSINDAKSLIRRTKISQILENGWRGSLPADMEKLEDVVVAFAHFLEEHPEVKEVDINPLIVSPEKVIALDARIILHEKLEK